ncbi:PEP-CTERM sorting domain-containing protein [Thalassomonas haliotis]|uniref:PEP-CTERM sorting domain-containing protein n=1 Tax=Thalassomonas haliotis TaxID=485448 RepID=A0ABY7VK91_9GAMM|nr:PEP-CTERM sorting domain-containing protein [Thalassomonas haliotis]WDE13420.1 PEP-CTERM sorting domain-containing protein [Thalassomonas haliotis]
MKKISKWITALSITFTSVAAVAADIPATSIMDNYVGAGYGSDVYGGESQFDIDQMVVSRTGTTMSVGIYTAFSGNDNYQMGDLFMSADPSNPDANPWNPAPNDRYSDSSSSNTGTDWNYAYTIRDWSGTHDDRYNDRDDTSGRGRLVSGFDQDDLRTSSENHGNRSRADQAVSLNASSYYNRRQYHAYDNIHSGWSNWNTTDNVYSMNGISYNLISFEFDVAGTALATANQIAFRWAMSCANDIIEGLVSINGDGPVDVPEPETLLLLLLGLGGIVARRKIGSQKMQPAVL